VGLAITFYPIKLEGDDLEKLSTTTTGLVVGAIMGAMHLLWSVLVAAGWGQPTMNLIFWMYFIKPVNLIEPFESIRAISLVVATCIIGFVFGWAAARLWNRLRAQIVRPFERQTVHRITRVL
jgi:hypothetical protein